ncbi:MULTISPECIES: imidazolonepropionase [Ramlibacter]|uniref:Imidazolonepropionase n=1 Tax=Ramlibacter pinisoli TaxID=2682844 RepID=A0A6N8J1E8_9BURK|nr:MULTISPECIES: imidazolonepropionase [Ramlibacter]MBA2962723.1 imidazolonepropionase [Ramlibacter sp. CGMCC 1.13660]MVQ32665.1 imidazolonepropionase [Ramlibacter pinisoli]
MSRQLWTHARLATLAPGAAAPYGLVDDGALAVEDGTIAWVGPRAELPPAWRRGVDEHDAGGALVTPGLVDCHTHLVWAGDRAREFELRLQGASYEAIAQAGGGIVSTVRATRAASEAELLAQSRRRLRALLAEGATTVEIKSGYGLSEAAEAKCLRVARRLGAEERVTVRTTFLGAHALPPEFAGRPDAYIDEVVRMLPLLHAQGLVDAVDAFCERIGFSLAQTQRVFEAARALRLPVKLHAEQLSDSAGTQLAAGFGALSCDHLEWLGEDGVRAMARAGTVAVLLPGAYYFLRDTRVPPVDLLRRHGVPMAVSTDCNPGTSPCTSLLLMLNMACTLFRLTPEEALAGATRHAARALGLADRGVLAAGRRADFVLWDVAEPAQLAYAFGANPCRTTIVEGTIR